MSLVMVMSCLDPAHDDAVSALGPEASGVREGPTHRPGQPCTVCHGALGPGPQFAVAGTVFDRRDGTTGLSDVTITLTDKDKVVKTLRSNEVGNFYISIDEYSPTYPLDVQISQSGIVKTMNTQIGRDGGCAVCHRGSGDAQHTRAVFLKELTDP